MNKAKVKAKSQKANKGLSKSVVNLDQALQNLVEQAKSSQRKFTESVEVVLYLDVDEKTDAMRGSFELPNNTGKDKKIAVFVDDESDKAKACLEAGADRASMDELINEIANKNIKYDVFIGSQSIMPKLKKIASILGSRGKMPNAKIGTLTESPEKIIPNLKNKTIFFKSVKGVVQVRVGSVAMSSEQLMQNITNFSKYILEQFKAANPTKEGLRAMYIKSTMGKSFAIDAKQALV